MPHPRRTPIKVVVRFLLEKIDSSPSDQPLVAHRTRAELEAMAVAYAIENPDAELDERCELGFREFLLSTARCLRNYQREAAALDAQEQEIIHDLAQQPTGGVTGRRHQIILTVLTQQDLSNSRPPLRTATNISLATELLDRWPSNPAPALNTLRFDLQAIRRRVREIARERGFPSAELFGLKLTDDLLTANNSPVRAAIELIDDIAPLAVVRADIIEGIFVHTLRSLAWSEVHPWAKKTYNHRFVDILAERHKRFESRVRRFCQKELHDAREWHYEVIVAIFRLSMRLALLSPLSDEYIICVQSRIAYSNELNRLLDLSWDDDIFDL